MYHKYFEPISDKTRIIINNLMEYQLGKKITFFDETFPSVENKNIVLIGIGETANNFRSYFYQLSNHFKNTKIIDLGNLKPEKLEHLNSILEYYLSKNTFPIIISKKDITLSFLSKQRNNNLSDIIVVDKKISLPLNEKSNPNDNNITLYSNSEQVLNWGIIGYQSYYVNPETISFLNSNHYNYLRLGLLKKNIELSEPLIRDADFMSFNLAALKKIEVPSSSGASPSGLFAEEACQLVYYAGISDKMRMINIHGYDINNKDENQTAQTLSQMVWYFIYGVHNRKNDYPVSMNNFREFIVNFKTSNYQITFWKSIKSDRWWMEIPVKGKSKTPYQLIPCSYEDYLEAGNGNLPERLLNAYQRFE